MTDAERLLWYRFRQTFPGIRLRRQHSIGPYIVDFAIPSRRLVIEIDGGQHAVHASDDAKRTGALGTYGYRVFRFWNNDVIANTHGVLTRIRAEIE